MVKYWQDRGAQGQFMSENTDKNVEQNISESVEQWCVGGEQAEQLKWVVHQ